MGLEGLLNSVVTGQGAAEQLHKQLKDALSKKDQGLSVDQQSKKFIEQLKAYSDSIDNSDQAITDYLKAFGDDVSNKDSPDNPRPPAADRQMTKDGPPADASGTKNPFFSPSPMATFFQTFMSIIKMQGYIAKIKSETGIENMKATLEIGKDQANSILQQAEVEANSLNKQAAMDYVSAGLNFLSAAGTFLTGMKQVAKNSKERKEAEKAIKESTEDLNKVSQFNKNKNTLREVQQDSKGIEREANNLETKLKLQHEKAQAANQKLSDQDELILENVSKKPPKETKEELEAMQKNAKLEQKKLKEDIDIADKEHQNLEDQIQNKQDEIKDLKQKIANGNMSRKEIEESKNANKQLHHELDELKDKQKTVKGKLAIAKAKHEGAVSDELYTDYKLAKADGSGKSKAEIAQAKTDFEQHHNKFIRDNKTVMDNPSINPGDKAEILGEKDRVFKNFGKITENDDLKLSKLKQREQIATERQSLLNEDQSRITTAFKKSKEGKPDGFEQIKKFEDNPAELEKSLNTKLQDNQAKLRDLKRSTLNEVQQNWKWMAFNDIIRMSNSIVEGRKKNIDAQGKLEASVWEARKSMDATYLQIMQQAMMTMLDASKSDIEVGSQYAQALMGLSDKEVNTVHWSV